MTTKPKLKKIPLPKGWPALPEGSVNLGRGSEKMEDVFLDHMDDLKYYCYGEDDEWDQGFWAGSSKTGFYAAPADSAIAREILGEPAKPVTKRKAAKKTVTKPAKTVTKSAKAQKTITLRKLPKNVKPGTKVVCVDDDFSSRLLKKGKTYSIESVIASDLLTINAVRGKWMHERFRLAPDKKPHVQRSKRIGMMRQLADLNPVLSEFGKNALKFGEAFARSAERDGISIPDWLPALPPVPAGRDRWEPRGPEWAINQECLYGYAQEWDQRFVVHDEACLPLGTADFYIEAVRDEKPEAATNNANTHIELLQKEISRIGSPTPYAADYWPHKAEEMRRNSAVGLLTEAAETIGARAAERDVESERSMAKCVSAFNMMFGKDITEEQGWLFMALLKMSRSTVGHRRDDFLDGAAYMSLAGECALNQEKP